MKDLLQLEKRHSFPIHRKQVVPTKSGNAIRTLEEYGFDRYRLDSQVLWTELWASVPESLRQDHDRARAGVDFFVNTLDLLVAYGLGDRPPASSLWTIDRPHWSPAPSHLLFVPLWWRSAITSVDAWHSVVQAMVNVGRSCGAGTGSDDLDTIDDERQTRVTVRWSVYWPYDKVTATDSTAFRDVPPADEDEATGGAEVLEEQNEADGSCRGAGCPTP